MLIQTYLIGSIFIINSYSQFLPVDLFAQVQTNASSTFPPSHRDAHTNYSFVTEMCRERLHRMDWRQIVKPCEGKLTFGANVYSNDRTNVNYSYIHDKIIRNAGEYSSFLIKTHDMYNSPKSYGGDTWRVFVEGPSYFEPYVYDLNSGEYDVSFLVMEPGTYTIKIILEGSLCSSYVNPPHDWFKKGDFNGHFQNEWQYKNVHGWPYLLRERMWLSLTNFTITVQPGNDANIEHHLKQIRNWQKICGLTKCNFLTDGIGRWIQNSWKPFSDYVVPCSNNSLQQQRRQRRRKGLLWIYGDCYAYHFWQSIHNTTLCTKQFNKCNSTYNWVYPRWNPDSKKDKSIHLQRHFEIDLPWLVNYFKKVMSNPELNNKDSGMFLNLGLHFIRSTSFQNYCTLIREYVSVIKSHKTKVVWRTTTAIYKPENKVHKRFQTYQRALLFNAFSMATMCNAGIPIIDVFPMTSSYPHQPDDGIHFDIGLFKPIQTILRKYYHFV